MKVLKIAGGIVGVLVVILIVGLTVLGALVPETYVYLGHEVPKKYLQKIRGLGLLEQDEKVVYFYTDALIDIKKGMYFVTDEHLVLYSETWEEPAIKLDLESLLAVEVQYNESFFEDSLVTVEDSEFEYSFPVSSEKGRDKKFVEQIRSKMKVEEEPLLENKEE